MKNKVILRLTESDLHNIIKNCVIEEIRQEFGSANTSINKNKTASGFPFFGGTAIDKKVVNQNGKANLHGKKVW